MDAPRFANNQLNPRLADGDLGDAFQRFIYDLLRDDYDDLHLFRTKGNDGAIDLSQTITGSRLIIECKHIGADGLTEAKRRWREVKDHLDKHLSDANGPTKGEPQYGPWYQTHPAAITQYLFCVSSDLRTQEERDKLQGEITEYFFALAAKHNHLAHLAGIEVKILDWSDLYGRLQRQPYLLFRWFPQTRPQGLVPLEDARERGTFRSYLFNDTLLYYSRGQHLKAAPAPPGLEIADEEALLAELDSGRSSGLILTGEGGVGKTRLTLEIGRLAREKGWVVLRATSRLKDEGLERLAESLTPDDRVLLLFDYVETQRAFLDAADQFDALNDELSLQLRYVANCRTSYYRIVEATAHHRRIALSPMTGDAATEWVEQYQQRTVHHILEQSGLVVTQELLQVCGDTPILAVFVSYLHTTQRRTELAELLREADFSQWVRKRVQLSFGSTVAELEIARRLALLVALFPIEDAATYHPLLEPYQRLRETLATDGWIERLPPDETHETETWVTAHDVLADRILLSFLESIDPNVEHFVHDLLRLAREVGCLRSALTSLQRLVAQPLLAQLNWLKIIESEMTAQPAAWRAVRDVLIRTPLLNSRQIIGLLGKYEEIWSGIEQEVEFQKSLGWLVRNTKGQDENELEVMEQAIPISWIKKAAPYADTNNTILTCGIRLCPEDVHEHALRWITTRPRLFQTHFLMVAWLNQRLSVDEIASSVQQWAIKFRESSHLSFIIRAWLEAGGNKEVVQWPMQTWLNQHGTSTEARFVYKSWLDAKQDASLIREHLADWLTQHGTIAEAEFVYEAWLDAKQDASFVREHIAAWLTQHGISAQARFVYKAWLDAKQDASLIREHLAAWLAQHGTIAEAQFVYKSWLDAKQDASLIREHLADWLTQHGHIAEAQFVYKSWLNATKDASFVREYLAAWLTQHGTIAEAEFVYEAWLDAKQDASFVREHIAAWLTQHGISAEAGFVYTAWLDATQDESLVRKHIAAWLTQHGISAEARFVYKSWLDAEGDTDLIQDYLAGWLAVHGEQNDSDFVYKAWLDAGGDFSVVREQAIQWLRQNYDKPQAVYLTKYIAQQRDLPVQTVRDILNWCRLFSDNEDAIYRLTQLKTHLFNQEVGEEVCATAEAVLKALITGNDLLLGQSQSRIYKLLSFLIGAIGLREGELRGRVDDLFLAWLWHPDAYGANLKPHFTIQRRAYFQRLVDLITSGDIDVTKDAKSIMRFLQWVNNWEPESKATLQSTIAYLKRKHPADLWDIVQL